MYMDIIQSFYTSENKEQGNVTAHEGRTKGPSGRMLFIDVLTVSPNKRP